MIRGFLVLALVIAGLTIGIGFAARWQPPGLLNVLDRVWPGPGGTMVAEAQPYGPSPFQQVDVFAPADMAQGETRPVIVFFHGGGWVKGSRDTYGFVGRAFASQGFVTVIAGYRLQAEGRWPVFMQDGAAAVRWTQANVARYGGDPTRIVLAGHSAGAHIAVLSALDPRWLGDMVRPGGAVRGAIGLSGPYDFAPFEAGGRAQEAMGHVADVRQTQPIHFARADAPGLLLITGDSDTTVKPRNAARLDAAMNALLVLAQYGAESGNPVTRPVTRIVYPGVDHNGTIKPLALLYRDDQPVLADAVAFARSVTR